MKNDALLIENYILLLEQLPEEDKLEIIIRLSKKLKIKSKSTRSQALSESLYGALDDKDSAEVWIERIRSARHFNRNTESL
jgi:hypothetical protein